MATKTSTTNVSSLIINKVDSKTTFQNMLTNNQVNENEFYLIPSELESSSEVFSIAFNTTNGTTYSCNKTYSEVISAINDGYPIYAVISNNSEPVKNLNYTVGTNEIVFSTGLSGTTAQTYLKLTYNNSNNISTTQVAIQTDISNASLTIGPYTYDGTTAVTIQIYDGSYTQG